MVNIKIRPGAVKFPGGEGFDERLMKRIRGADPVLGKLQDSDQVDADGNKIQYMCWSQMAQLMVEAELSDDILTTVAEARAAALNQDIAEVPRENRHMISLAIRLGTTVASLNEMKAMHDPEEWETRKLERFVVQERIRTRAKGWQELEMLTMERLVANVEAGVVTDTNELLGIATVAARMNAAAAGTSGTQEQEKELTMTISPSGDLPGAGNLGTIKLTLNHRVKRQLESEPRNQDGDRFLDSIEMLSAGDVPEMIKIIDGKGGADG